jgi:hypothetical protein
LGAVNYRDEYRASPRLRVPEDRESLPVGRGRRIENPSHRVVFYQWLLSLGIRVQPKEVTISWSVVQNTFMRTPAEVDRFATRLGLIVHTFLATIDGYRANPTAALHGRYEGQVASIR